MIIGSRLQFEDQPEDDFLVQKCLQFLTGQELKSYTVVEFGLRPLSGIQRARVWRVGGCLGFRA